MEMDLWHKFTRPPEGRLKAAGVRPGDIPIGTHGRLWVFYGQGAKSYGLHQRAAVQPNSIQLRNALKINFGWACMMFLTLGSPAWLTRNTHPPLVIPLFAALNVVVAFLALGRRRWAVIASAAVAVLMMACWLPVVLSTCGCIFPVINHIRTHRQLFSSSLSARLFFDFPLLFCAVCYFLKRKDPWHTLAGVR